MSPAVELIFNIRLVKCIIIASKGNIFSMYCLKKRINYVLLDK